MVPSDGGIEFMGPAGAPLALSAAPDGRERRGEHLPGAAASLEQGAKLRTAHTLAPFRPEAALVEDGQDHQFGRRSLKHGARSTFIFVAFLARSRPMSRRRSSRPVLRAAKQMGFP